ncbi:hypothetical protein JB92DRAFT_3109197 [Gautieria morchelliformis]|nr:hypothetical protein JB92DRAFT_3109197 [Gautieria morchelliformis]
MSSGSVQDLIVLGGQLLLEQYCLVSSLALLFYEHLLTLGDEVRYIWSNRVTLGNPLNSASGDKHMALNHALASFLFFVVRSLVLWTFSIVMSSRPDISSQSASATTKWGEAAAAFPCSLLILDLKLQNIGPFRAWGFHRDWYRIQYSTPSTCICVVQSTFVYAFPGHGPLPAPPIDVPAFQGCLYLPSPRLKDGAYTPFILELTFDVSIIGLIMAKSWKDRSLNGLMEQGGILRIIVKDGIIYFLVIFSTMFIWLCMVLFAPPGLKLVNSGSSNVLISIMINRLTINLHRSVKGNYGTSLTPSAVQHNAVPTLPTWMINTQVYNSSSDIDRAVISDVGDLSLSHESQRIELVEILSSKR